VLARYEGFQCPLEMERIWEGYVYKVDKWVGEEILVGSVPLFEVVFASMDLSGLGVSRSNGVQYDIVMRLYRIDD
jgi:hypothetical protein